MKKYIALPALGFATTPAIAQASPEALDTGKGLIAGLLIASSFFPAVAINIVGSLIAAILGTAIFLIVIELVRRTCPVQSIATIRRHRPCH